MTASTNLEFNAITPVELFVTFNQINIEVVNDSSLEEFTPFTNIESYVEQVEDMWFESKASNRNIIAITVKVVAMLEVAKNFNLDQPVNLNGDNMAKLDAITATY